MQETCLQQLNEVAVQQGGAQLPDVTGCALTQLLPCTQILFLLLADLEVCAACQLMRFLVSL